MSRLASRANVAPYQAYRAATPNPLTVVPWTAAYWAGDPSWSNPGDGNAVSSWRDGTGNGYTLAQGTGGAQPTFRASVTNLNGQPGVDLDGGDWMSVATPAFTQPLSLVVVVDMVSVTGTPVIVDAGSVGRAALFANAPTNVWAWYLGTAAVTTTYAATTGAHAIRAVANNASSSITQNMRTTTGTLGSATGFTGITLGALIGGASNRATMRVGFAGWYSGDVTAHAGWPDLVSAIGHLYRLNLA